MKQRFDVLRLNRVFGTFEKFVDATQWHQFYNLKYQIESMRSYASISGYVLTELTDVHWEANGLMDMRRNPRIFRERFAEINTDVVIIPKTERWAFWCGETIEIAPLVSAGGTALPADTILEWALEGHKAGGRLPLGSAEPLSVRAFLRAVRSAERCARLRTAAARDFRMFFLADAMFGTVEKRE